MYGKTCCSIFLNVSSDKIVGSPQNGNYLGTLELIALFDPFLAQHINRNANKGRRGTSYLSKTICEEFIQLMATRVREHIVNISEHLNCCRLQPTSSVRVPS